MRIVLLVLLAAGSFTTVVADHGSGCVPTAADPATVNEIQVPLWGVYYVEERGVPAPLNTDPPIPGSGFLLADGTWIYEEYNGIPGIQRGGTGGPCFPSEDVCLLVGIDPINDENCGHGPDILRF